MLSGNLFNYNFCAKNSQKGFTNKKYGNNIFDTQEALAKEVGVNFSTVSRWRNGKTKPNKIQQYHIEKFLKEKKIK